jgi:hypothetical protein
MLIKKRMKNDLDRYYYELHWDPIGEDGFYPKDFFGTCTDKEGIRTIPQKTPELADEELRRIEERIQKSRKAFNEKALSDKAWLNTQ